MGDVASLDVAILRVLYAGAWSPGWVKVVLAVTFLGSGWMMLPLLLGFFLRGWRVPAAAATLLLLVTAGVVAAIKAVAPRVRPCNSLAWAHALSLDLPTDPSFPSGHSAGSFAFAFFVWSLRPRVGAVLVLLAALVAVSRVALGVHYPSDVTAGAALGAALGTLGARFYRDARERWRPADTT